MPEAATTHLRRALALLVPCLATVLAAVAVAWWYRAPLVEVSTKTSGVERLVVPEIRRWVRRIVPDAVRGVFFGDSLTMAHGALGNVDGKGGMPELLEQPLRAAGTPVDILAVTHPAFRPVHFAYLLDEVLAGHPRFAVVEINLRLVAPTWTALSALRFLPLSRKLSTRRQLELAPFLREEGIGTFHPGVYRVQEALSLLYVMDGVRIAGHDWLGAQSSRVEQAVGLQRNERPVQSLELNDDAAAYASRFAEGSSAAILRMLDRDLAASGVWTLYYVSPLNPDALAAAGATDDGGLAARVDELRVAAGIPHERWLDLHAGMPASSFVDQLNHLRPSALRVVAAKLLQRLRPVIAGLAAASAR